MKLRFDVNQAESFRRGVDCPKTFEQFIPTAVMLLKAAAAALEKI